MTFAELKTLLVEATELPVAYRKFRKPQSLPFICYKYAYGNDLFADNKIIFKCGRIHVELYTAQKDPAKETLVENALSGAGIPYRKFEAEIEKEDMLQVIYDCSIPGL